MSEEENQPEETPETAAVEEAPAAVAEKPKPKAKAKAKAVAKAAGAADDERGLRKTRVGIVVSDRMEKTIVVSVVRRVPHPLFKKIIKQTTKLYAHDEKSEAKVGDRVKVMETRPLSKLKRWRLLEVIAH